MCCLLTVVADFSDTFDIHYLDVAFAGYLQSSGNTNMSYTPLPLHRYTRFTGSIQWLDYLPRPETISEIVLTDNTMFLSDLHFMTGLQYFTGLKSLQIPSYHTMKAMNIISEHVPWLKELVLCYEKCPCRHLVIQEVSLIAWHFGRLGLLLKSNLQLDM